jgi:anti-anti-sigma factor
MASILTPGAPRYTHPVNGSAEKSMPPADLKVQIRPGQENLLVQLTGEAHFDFDAGDRYVREILQHKPKVVIVDASKLTFASSVGMNFLLNLRKAMLNAGGELLIAGFQPQVSKALENAKLLHLFATHPSAEEARNAASATHAKKKSQ